MRQGGTMLTDDEREERALLYERVYGRGAGPEDHLVRRLRELEERAQATPAAPAAESKTPSMRTGEGAPASDRDGDEAPAEDDEPNPRRHRLRLGGPRRTAVLPVVAAVAGLVGGALIGASFSPPSTGGEIPELSYAATGEDRLPFPDISSLLDPASVRFVASLDNGLVYVGRRAEVPGEVCLGVVVSSASSGATAQCGATDVTAQVDPETWVVIGEPSSAKMNDIVLSRFETRQLSESVRLYVLRDRS